MLRALIALLPVVVLTMLGAVAARADAPAWQRQLVLPGGDIYDATFATPEVVWAGGTGGIFVSTDAGRSWSLAYNSPQPIDAIAAAPDGKQGWAVGPLGLIVATTDGGATWHQQTSGTQVNLRTVVALGGGRAMAAGVGSGFSDVIMEPQPNVILRTEDGGSSWTELRFDAGYRSRLIDFLPDGKHGWIAADRCVPPAAPPGAMGCDLAAGLTVLQSADGGASWAPVGHDVSLYSMQFVSTSAGWALGCLASNCAGELLRTNDGGATWQLVRSPAPSAFWVFDEQHLVIAEHRCENGCITQLLQTNDGGGTWQEISTPLQGFTQVVQFSGGDNGVLLGMNGNARWTATAGSDWHDAEFPVVVGSGAVDFIDDAHGWLAASKLLRTQNGGATWTAISDSAFAAIDFVSLTEGWATQWDCSGECRTAVFHTTDSGATWAQQFATSNPNPPQLVFKTASDGWLLFEGDGRALHTRDGGTTWYEQALPTKPSHFGNPGIAVFVDGNVGWSALVDCDAGWSNCRGRAYRTLDGGDNWSTVTDYAPGDCYATSIAATDARHVWVEVGGCLGNEWTMYRSEDAGNSWSATPLSSQLLGTTFFDAATGRAIAGNCDRQGCSSRLARTSDGGATWVLDTTAADANPYGSRVEFSSPEHVWLASDRGGGMTSTFSQAIWAFAGTDSPTPERPVIAPDTGSGPQLPDDGDWPYAALLAAIGATLIAIARRVRRVDR